MANEVRTTFPTGFTIYATIREPDGDVYYPTGEAFEAWGTGSRDYNDYAIVLTEDHSHYTVDFPSAISAETINGYDIQLWRQKGSSPASSDICVAIQNVKWTGTAVAAEPTTEQNATALCNLALLKIGGASGSKKLISDINGTSETEEICALIYPKSRDFVLAMIPYKETVVYDALDDLTSSLPELAEWNYAFDLPSDCIRFLGVVDESDHTLRYDFEIVGAYIFANEFTNSDGDKLYVKYVKRETDASLYQIPFVEALVTKLAAELSPSIAKEGRSLRLQLLKEFVELTAPLTEGLDAANQYEAKPANKWFAARQG